jgi:hypothetical protein
MKSSILLALPLLALAACDSGGEANNAASANVTNALDMNAMGDNASKPAEDVNAAAPAAEGNVAKPAGEEPAPADGNGSKPAGEGDTPPAEGEAGDKPSQ